MNTIFKKVAVLTIVGMLFTSAVKATSSEKADSDSNQCMELNIKVMEKNTPLSGATIVIYHKDKTVAKFHNYFLQGAKSHMLTKLKRNTYYIIEVSKRGYITKSVIVSTLVPENVIVDKNSLFRHETKIVLVKQVLNESVSATYDTTEPIGLIYYDSQKKNFMSSLIITDPENDISIVTMVQKLGF